MAESIRFYISLISALFKRPLLKIAIGVFLGFVIGLVILLLPQFNVSESVILITGAFAGVFAEILVEFVEKAILVKRQLTPLCRVLGSIADDNAWIYISAMRRDLNDLEHFQLYRNDIARLDQPIISGSSFVYGKGDAIALSYLHKAIEKASSGKNYVTVEDSGQMLNYWGRSAICIGAHNPKTREILDKFKSTYFRFDMNYSIISKSGTKPNTNKSGVQFIQAVKAESGHDSSNIDYAVILKLKDEYFPEKNIIVIAGLGDNGTAGAAFYLLAHYDKLPYEQDTFGVLIEVPSGYESAREVQFDQIAKTIIINAPEKELNK